MSSSASGTILTSKAAGFTEETFKAFLRERDEPSWLTERRREAFARFQASAWPSARDEEWRRTDIRGFQARWFQSPVHGATKLSRPASRSTTNGTR